MFFLGLFFANSEACAIRNVLMEVYTHIDSLVSEICKISIIRPLYSRSFQNSSANLEHIQISSFCLNDTPKWIGKNKEDNVYVCDQKKRRKLLPLCLKIADWQAKDCIFGDTFQALWQQSFDLNLKLHFSINFFIYIAKYLIENSSLPVPNSAMFLTIKDNDLWVLDRSYWNSCCKLETKSIKWLNVSAKAKLERHHNGATMLINVCNNNKKSIDWGKCCLCTRKHSHKYGILSPCNTNRHTQSLW